ncbi:hypothetical protein PG2093B_1014 [Bifidobacterium pseudolongum subsp. globosum]|uniref:Uncharacterized protein n=1 Tax=Bifidobacterium pseudolongum subsp. globosum TaxID=1690 RepID=A0A4Q5A0C4_9BIFI|nr:hypothetical protein [Bifidobacterium pseudolongum]RYQ10431.1 hypothetical protein PG2093B_1014 [Bifidobacterium pseudolongum subsp. globosum]
MSETITITPTAVSADADADARPVKIQYGHIKMQLPRLDDSAQLPIELLTSGLSVVARGWDNLTQDEQIGVLAVFLAYLQREYPLLGRELDKSGDKIADLGAIINAWGTYGDTDPKA